MESSVEAVLIMNRPNHASLAHILLGPFNKNSNEEIGQFALWVSARPTLRISEGLFVNLS
jgi:hypothetical protein